jgi:hypothetical protein
MFRHCHFLYSNKLNPAPEGFKSPPLTTRKGQKRRSTQVGLFFLRSEDTTGILVIDAKKDFKSCTLRRTWMSTNFSILQDLKRDNFEMILRDSINMNRPKQEDERPMTGICPTRRPFRTALQNRHKGASRPVFSDSMIFCREPGLPSHD